MSAHTTFIIYCCISSTKILKAFFFTPPPSPNATRLAFFILLGLVTEIILGNTCNSIIQNTLLSTVRGKKTKDPPLKVLYSVIVQLLNVAP